MAGNLEEYRRFFRDLHVEAEDMLFGIHVFIFAVLNALWVMLNLQFVPSKYRWIMFYPLIGWGTLLFVHWWFYVRNAEKLCVRREKRVASTMIKPS